VYWLVIAILLAIGGVSVALGGLLLAQYQESHGVPAARWWALSVYTCFLFGYVIREFRRNWRQLEFPGFSGDAAGAFCELLRIAPD
jgi:hypothetical protein